MLSQYNPNSLSLTYSGHHGHGRSMLCRLEGRKLNGQQELSQISLLTLHTQDKTMDDLENPHCNCPSLVGGKSIQPFQHRLIVLPSRKRPHHFLSVVLSQMKRQRGETHLVVLD